MTYYDQENQFLRQRLQKEIPILTALIQNSYKELDRKYDKTVPIRDTYQRLQKAQKEKDEVVQYKIGDSVTHPKFGNGIVEKINPRSGGVHLHIRFNEDAKCIDQKWLIKKYKK